MLRTNSFLARWCSMLRRRLAIIPILVTILLALPIYSYAQSKLIVEVGPEVVLNFIGSCENATSLKTYLKNSLKNYEKINVEKLEGNLCEAHIIVSSWNKSIFVYNISPIINLSGGKVLYIVKPDKYLKINNIEPKEGVTSKNTIYIEVSVDYNKILFALILFLGIPGISGLILVRYIKRKTDRILGYEDKVKVSSSIGKASGLYVILVIACSLISLFLYDFPAAVTFIANIPIEVSVIGYMVFMFAQMFAPLIYSIKYTSKLYGKEKATRKDYIYSTLFVASFLLVYIVIFPVMTLLPDWFYDLLSLLPAPVQTAFWFLVGFSVAHIILTITNRLVFKRLEKPVEPWIVDLVNELTEKLGAKKFKRIIKVETVGGKVANAMVSGIFNKELIITERLTEVLNKEELKAILAHEIAHKKQKHIEIILLSWFIFGVSIFTGISYLLDYLHKKSYENMNLLDYFGLLWFILFVLGYTGLTLLTRYIQRKAERKADLEASKVVDPRIYIKALAKITIIDLIPMNKGRLEVLSTHPSTFKRIYEVGRRNNLSDEEISKIIQEAYEEIVKKL